MHKNSIKEYFESFINDPGIQLSHREKDKILLEDIFIFPDLVDLNNSIISSKELLNIDDIKNNFVITGSEDSGKTTLLKVLIKHYLHSGYYPIYLDTENFTVLDSNELLKIIDREYEEAYNPNAYENIKSEGKQNKAIFIDNFDKLNCSPEVMYEILDSLQSLSTNLFLTEKTPLNALNNSNLRAVFPELTIEAKKYEIMEFTSNHRLQLIHKWVRIGKDDRSDTGDEAITMEKTQHIIDSVVEHNIVPSYPIYLLTILQMENLEEEVSPSTSSYGQYYEYLILKSLQKIVGKESINKYLDLLSKLCFYMFDTRNSSISYEDISSIHSTSLLADSSFQDILDHLVKTDILYTDGRTYSLKYKYVYHYFVAKYLSENLDSESTKNIIEELCSKLYNDESANIILFITHHSEDTSMIDELTERAQLAFSDIEGISTEEELSRIDELIVNLSTLGTKDRKLKEAILQYSNSGDHNSEFDFQKIRRSYNAAMNIIRIAGQIVTAHRK